MSEFNILIEELLNTGVTTTHTYTNVVVEAFDPDTAEKNGFKYHLDNIGGVQVVFPDKAKSDSSLEGIHDSDKTIIINQNDLGGESFCKHNPAIRKFASENAENMCFVIGLAIATQGIAWDDFRNVYPVLWSFIKEMDGEFLEISSIIGLDGKVRGEKITRKYFRGGVMNRLLILWGNRHLIYEDIYERGLIDNPYELFGYLHRNINGLALVKAGFATQLLAGKYGCMDNINMDIYGMPTSIAKLAGKNLGATPASWNASSKKFPDNMDATTDYITKGTKHNLEGYIEFLKIIANINETDNSSQILWDDWVSMASIKTLYASSHKQIALVRRFGGKDNYVVMPTYPLTNDRAESGWDDELRSGITKDDPYGGGVIGKDHLTLPKSVDDIIDASDRIIYQPFSNDKIEKLKLSMYGGRLDRYRHRK